MNKLSLQHTIPAIFSEADVSASEVWLKNVNFSKGKMYLVSAVSGMGKTSLLSYIFGERDDYKGTILFDDENINSLNAADWLRVRQKELSFIFQGLRLFTDLTVYENIELKNRLTGFKTKAQIEQLLEKIGIAEKSNIKARYLSFGQQQRVAIVRALCQPFDFLLMDEPYSHLDEENIKLLSSIIDEDIKQRGAGLLITSLGTKYPFDYDSVLKL